MSREELDYLSVDDLLEIAEAILPTVEVRDVGLLAAAADRPRASAFGAEAYPSFAEKVAAVLHSVARNHALVDGNKRLSLAGLIAFYGLNGVRLTLTNDEAYDLIITVATGELDTVAEIAAVLREVTEPYR